MNAKNTPVSFTVDHTRLTQGIYLTSTLEGIYTYDIRLTAPCQAPEKALSSAVSHSLEHCMAVFFRLHGEIKSDVVYVGPMGCLTGFYLVTRKEYPEMFIRDLFVECLESILLLDEIPAMNAVQCGNPTLQDMEGLKKLCGELIPVFGTCRSFTYPYIDEKG